MSEGKYFFMRIYTYDESDLSVDYNCISDNPNNILYFDIETTGLDALRSELYMIGYGEYADGIWRTTLLFNDDGHSETDMLERFSAVIRSHSILVSYNGDTFDIPYIRKRLSMNDLPPVIDIPVSTDIYKVVRRYKKLLSLSSARQIDVEDIIRFRRNTFISGGKLIDAYTEYISGQPSEESSESLLKELLTHNHDDIRGLMSITGFFNLTHITDTYTIDGVQEDEHFITYTCTGTKLPCRITASARGAVVNICGSILTLRIEKYIMPMRYYFRDYRNYYYLPLEHTVIHKSVAAYVDSSHKEKATKDNAYVTKNSCFIIKPKQLEADTFYDTDYRGDSFIELEESLRSCCQTAEVYVNAVIQMLLS